MIRARIRARRAARRGDTSTDEVIQPHQGGLIRGLITSLVDNHKSRLLERTTKDGMFHYDYRNYERSHVVGRKEVLAESARSPGGRYESFGDRGHRRDPRRGFGQHEVEYEDRYSREEQRRDNRYAEAGYGAQNYEQGGGREPQVQGYVNYWVEGQGSLRRETGNSPTDEPEQTFRRFDRGEGLYEDTRYSASVVDRQRAPPEYR
jgi:hypothetical protein